MRKSDKYKLSPTELEIMEFIWKTGKDEIMARDVLEYFNNEKGKTWDRPTVAVFLKGLQKKGMIKAKIHGGRYYHYSPTMSEEEYDLLPAKELLLNRYKGSIADFFCALTGASRKFTPITSEDAVKQIDDMLAELEEMERLYGDEYRRSQKAQK